MLAEINTSTQNTLIFLFILIIVHEATYIYDVY